MDRFHAMQIYLAVAEELSMAAAARRLALSVPTITRAIDALELHLGTQLFNRNTQGVTLTEAGDRFLQDCRHLLSAVSDAEASARGLHKEPRGQLHLSMPLLFALQIAPTLLLDYLAEHVGVACTVQYQDHAPHLQQEGIDVAIVVGELKDSSLFASKVGYVRRIVCASPAYLSHQQGVPRSPHDLLQHSIIHNSADMPLLEWRFQQQAAALNLRLSSRLSCTSTQAAITAALCGAGLLSCLNFQVSQQLERGELQVVLQPFELPAVPVHVVYREGRKAATRVRSFVDYAVQRLRQHPTLLSANLRL
jgi:DNA-binding transcriptional LysR family regulator